MPEINAGDLHEKHGTFVTWNYGLLHYMAIRVVGDRKWQLSHITATSYMDTVNVFLGIFDTPAEAAEAAVEHARKNIDKAVKTGELVDAS